MISQIELTDILTNLESSRIERTVSTSDTDKFAEAICAFANDLPGHEEPGYLLIGVRDDGSLNHLEVTDKLLTNIGGLRSDGNILPQPVITLQTFSYPEGDVLVVEVQPSVFTPVRYKGRIWIRVGARKAVANESEERILIEKRVSNATTFDARPCFGSTLKDLKSDIFTSIYLPKAVASDVLKNDRREVKEQLASLRFFDLNYDCPTNAGILMFGINPEYFMFGAYVQYVKFKSLTLGSDILNENKFTGDYVTILSKLDTFIETSVVLKRPVPVSILREEIVRNYPYWAIRELANNAIMHRDYESNTPTRFYEFENRLEIMNPGGLYGNANPENFPTVNAYRNPVIAEAMKVLGYVNRFSRGVIRVQEELVENGNKQAMFDFSKRTVFEVVVNNAVQHLNVIMDNHSVYTPQATPQVTPQVFRLLRAIIMDSSKSELMEKLGLKDKKNFDSLYIKPALADNYIERTLPDNPNSPLQKYRITRKGLAALKAIDV